jgi:hypothetical protein
MKVVPYLPICIPAKFGEFWSTISLDFAFCKLKAVGKWKRIARRWNWAGPDEQWPESV